MSIRFRAVAMVMATAVLMSATSCSDRNVDPDRAALEAELASRVGPGAKVSFYTFEKIDSVTLGKELGYRIKVQDIRLRQNESLYKKYRSEGKETNAALKKEAMLQANRAVLELEKLRASLRDSLDVVVYYDYRFTGKASNKDNNAVFPEAYASISRDHEVLNIETDRKALHRGLGRVIPGYLDIIKAGDEE